MGRKSPLFIGQLQQKDSFLSFSSPLVTSIVSVLKGAFCLLKQEVKEEATGS